MRTDAGDGSLRNHLAWVGIAPLAIAATPLLLGESAPLAGVVLAAANLLPWLVIWLLLLAISRRPIAAMLGTMLLQASFLALNSMKMQQLGLPLVPADTAALEHLVRVPELYFRYLSGYAVPLALAVALAGAAWLEPARHGGCRRCRMALLGVALAGGGSLAMGYAPWPWLYGRDQIDVRFWMPAEAARDIGAVAHFLHLYLNTRSGLPEYDARLVDAADAWLQHEAQQGVSEPSAADLPDLIVIQSESFFDPGAMVGIDSAEFAPELTALRRAHAHGQLRVPAYGGLTTRTEFEFLSGFPLASEPQLQYPYQGLVHRPLAALPWTLRAAGYRTLAVHPYERRFYGRDRVFPHLGFESFHSIGEFDARDIHGYHISDAALNRRILELLDEDSAQFLFAVTIENHGPWDSGRALPEAELPALPPGPALDAEASTALRQFLHHTRRADAALGELAQWVLRREHPTVLLFYGDHLPALPDVFATWPFEDGLPAAAQSTPWLLIDNRRGGSERIDLDAAELAGVLLARAGIRDSSLFGNLETIRRARTEGRLGDSARDWHRHLAARQLHLTPAAAAPALSEGSLIAIEDWSPRSAESRSDDGRPLSFWLRFETSPDRRQFLRIGDERMRILERQEHLLVAQLAADAHARLLKAPGRHALILVDPILRRQQHLGEFVVRERAERMGGWWGIGSGPFCAIEGFGPESIKAASAPQGDAPRRGIWLRADCLPKDAQLVLGTTVLDTTVVDNLATAWVPDSLLREPGQVALRLRSREAQIEIATLPITP